MWIVLTLLIVASAVLWVAGVRPTRAWSKAGPSLATLAVDRGDLDVVVVEYGALQSTDNATVRCRVEALIGQVGGISGGTGRGGAGGTQGGAAGAAGGSLTTPGATAKAQASGAAAGKAATGKAATGKAATGSASSGAGAAIDAGAAGGGAAMGAAGGGGNQRPVIRSFTMQVAPHVPLRPQATSKAQTKVAQVAPGGPSGQGGGRSGGGSGSSMEMMEKPGSTRILWILPEGTRVQGQHLVAEPGHDAPLVPVLLGYVPVQAGDVVCELDASAFRTELEAQHIRHAQARAWVQQARAILEVSQISLREYRDGVYPQDQELIRQYVTTCRTEQVRAKAALVWSQDALRKHVRTPSQLQVDRLVAERAEIALSEAMRMQERLERYTAPRLLKSLEAKIAAVQSDLLTQQSAFLLEDERLRQLQAMVDHCIMRAPRDGVVVYAKQSNGWGRVEDQIREGVTVREGQPIFNLPDPNRMSVQVRVNESKVSLIRSGQRAVIRIDAFPDRPLGGTVAEVTPIPAPASGPGSDIKIYYALVTIDQGGFEGLRPGLSAEVSFLIGTRPGVTRVPVQAVRWVEGRPLVALETATGVRWRPIAVGTTGAGYAEVLSGLAPGERVVADPATLPPPEPVLARAD